MSEPETAAAAPLLARLATVGSPDDARPEVEVLAELDALAEQLQALAGAGAAEADANIVAGDVARLREHALDPERGHEALGALRSALAKRQKAIGVVEARKVPAAAERVLLRTSQPPLVHVPTGLPTLDAATRGGAIAQRLHVIAGEPDTGKTALLVQIALFVARMGWVVALHCIDEPRQWIEDRIGQAYGLSLEDLEANDGASIATLAKVLAKLPNLLLVGREDRFSAEDTADAAKALAQRLGAPGVFLGYDSLQKVRPRAAPAKGQRVDPRELIELTVEALLDIALSGPIVWATSEVGRSAYRSRGAKDRTAEMAAAKGSGAIEYAVTVEIVLSTITKGEYSGDVRAGVPKNKRGTDKGFAFRLERDRDRCTFTDRGRIAGDEDPAEAGDKPKASLPKGVDDKLVSRARLELAKHPQGIDGGLDGWASLLGVQLARARLACKHLLAKGEARAVYADGRKVYMARGALPSQVAEEAPANDAPPGPGSNVCAVCGVGGCPPCPGCGGCRRETLDRGGCDCP